MVVFRSYVSQDGVDQIKLWFDDQNEAVQADLMAVIETLEATSRNRWPESCFKQLGDKSSSKCAGLDELKVVVDRVHYRVFGFHGPGKDDFTMLLAIKKNDDPTYKASCTEAQKRKAEVVNDWNRTREWEAPASD